MVYTDVSTGTIYVVDWDGSNKKAIAKGFALCTWIDPNNGTQWVYAGKAENQPPIHRYQIDHPEVSQLVWSRACSCTHGWQVSADGTRMGSLFPHPTAGVGILPDGPFYAYGNGCEANLARDNSYRFFHMGESIAHGGVNMYDANGNNKRVVPFNIPGLPPRQESWAPRWSTDTRFLTVSSPNSGPKQELYLGQFDDSYTQVVRWIKITDQAGGDLCSDSWIDSGLGFRAGEVPITVQFTAPDAEGECAWDYGDGTKETAPAGKHTYTKPGTYSVTATRGGMREKGTVQASRAKAPSVTQVVFYDELHLALNFDERVQLKGAGLALKSGVAVKDSSLTPDGTRTRIELGGPIVAADTLTLDGIYDNAQVPNPLDKKDLRIQRPAWPSGRAGLVFLWEGDKKQNFQYDVNAKAFTGAHVRLQGAARYGRFGEMNLQGGVIFAVDAGRAIYDACTKSNQLTVQAAVLPANLHQGTAQRPTPIVSCDMGGGVDNVDFRLAQEADRLVFHLRNRSANPAQEGREVQRIELGTITDQAPSHVIVSYKPGDLACYLNGKKVVQTAAADGQLQWGNPSGQNGVNFGGSEH